ncbi:MAG: DUF3987 domain-containing protein [Candidatus Eremiobacteraeota bacterium]|nr:DUF3987 domain-containing protein [Candidatus Eremiobacteraeota bacterium]MBC5803453.1 DUF3987 domain-containing protein [Candidatus Eremiobacteraeota bacterium]MBC5823206.1 DUF3987 domain-containing protein [Candidatus Eremiobacteraeota bacterium]
MIDERLFDGIEEVTAPIDEGEIAHAWPALQKLPGAAVVAPTMPLEMVPEPLRPWVADICERMRVPVEVIVVPAVVAAATVVGRSLGIHPKRHDDWLVVPNLWGAIIARSGFLKSPALREALRPLMRLVYDASKHFEDSKAMIAPEQDYIKNVISALESDLKSALRKASAKKPALNPSELREQLESKQHERDALTPVEKRYLTNDTTIEKLGELLRDNPRGLLVFRDELTGLLRTLDAPDRPNDRAFYLECWNGDGRYDCDRIGRGTIHVESACISLLGGIQPGPLAEYVAGALGNGGGADGLLQRLQLAVWPDEFPAWENVDQYPDAAAKTRVFEVFEALDTFDPIAFGAEVDDERGFLALRFASDAQALFDDWRDTLEKRLRSDEMHGRPAFESHIAKYRSLMPSLALLYHLVDVAIGATTDARVSLRAAALAADWCGFLEQHAAKLYGHEVPPVGRGLAAKIERGAVRDKMALREIGRKGWSRLTTSEDVREAIAELEPYGWARIETRPTTKDGGRPSEVIRLHPDFGDD